MAEMAGVPVYIVHLSSEDALNQVREARDRGLPAFAETCPQYLLLSLEDVAGQRLGGREVCFHAAAAREEESAQTVGRLAQGQSCRLSRPTIAHFVSKIRRHWAKTTSPKFPTAAPASRTACSCCIITAWAKGNLSLNRFVELVSTAPARIFGMYPKKGVLAAGSDADIVLWDPTAEHTISAATHHMRVDYSMFEGFQGARQCARRVFARRVDRVEGRVYRQARPRPVPASRGSWRRLEIIIISSLCAGH
jgi:dihydropyrimidinase